MAQKLGVRSRLDVNGAYVPSIGLGAMDVSPLDMASAYATLAAGGIYSEPMAIRKVVLPDGEDTSAGWGKPKRKARDLGRRRLHGHEDPRGEHRLRHGSRRRLRAACGGQDGDDAKSGPTPGSAATPATRNDRLGRVPEGQDLDDERARGLRHRRQLPGADLAALHELGDRPAGAGGVPEPKSEPEWKDFERGQYARSFGYYRIPITSRPRRQRRRRRRLPRRRRPLRRPRSPGEDDPAGSARVASAGNTSSDTAAVNDSATRGRVAERF